VQPAFWQSAATVGLIGLQAVLVEQLHDCWHVPLVQERPEQHGAPVGVHATADARQVVVVVLVDVDVVPLTHTAAVPSDVAKGHPGLHASPAWQQVRLAPLPHGVLPAGHPHRP
jgi:hypothetical protein